MEKDIDTIVDIAAGYCNFINNISCNGKKYAFDYNPDVKKYAKDNVIPIVDSIQNVKNYFEDNSVSIFFMSNFLEHISKECIEKLFQDIYDLLKEEGQVWILTPNIRYVGGKYWDFFDHITPITEKSLIEVAKLNGLKVKTIISKFLPYTTKSKFPQGKLIVRLYLLLMPISGWFFGQQSFLIFSKS